MDKCDSFNGMCVCHPNVEGEKCDRCAVNHYGFGTCKVNLNKENKHRSICFTSHSTENV